MEIGNRMTSKTWVFSSSETKFCNQTTQIFMVASQSQRLALLLRSNNEWLWNYQQLVLRVCSLFFYFVVLRIFESHVNTSGIENTHKFLFWLVTPTLRKLMFHFFRRFFHLTKLTERLSTNFSTWCDQLPFLV